MTTSKAIFTTSKNNITLLATLLLTVLILMTSCQKEDMNDLIQLDEKQTEEALHFENETTTTIDQSRPVFSLENSTSKHVRFSNNTVARNDEFLIFEQDTIVEKDNWLSLVVYKDQLGDACEYTMTITPTTGDPNAYIWGYDGTDYRMITYSENSDLDVDKVTFATSDLEETDSTILFTVYGYEASEFHLAIHGSCDVKPVINTQSVAQSVALKILTLANDKETALGNYAQGEQTGSFDGLISGTIEYVGRETSSSKSKVLGTQIHNTSSTTAEFRFNPNEFSDQSNIEIVGGEIYFVNYYSKRSTSYLNSPSNGYDRVTAYLMLRPTSKFWVRYTDENTGISYEDVVTLEMKWTDNNDYTFTLTNMEGQVFSR